MANILDIFRTHPGEILLKKAGELTLAKEKELRQALTFSLPAILSILQKKSDFNTNRKHQDLISYLEDSDLISSGNECLEEFIEAKQLESLLNCNVFTDLNAQEFQKILSICCGVLAGIISQIQKDNENAEFSEIVETLSGYSVKYERAFIKTLVKNEDDPNLIKSSEKISLDRNNDKDDQSILGGYAGGR